MQSVAFAVPLLPGQAEAARAALASCQAGARKEARALVMHDQKDPSQVDTLVVFESEEKARAREQDPRRQERRQAATAMMAGIFDGPPGFTGLTVAGGVDRPSR